MAAIIRREKAYQRRGKFAWRWYYTITTERPEELEPAPWGRHHDGRPCDSTACDTLDEARRLARRIPGKPIETWRG